MVNEKKYVFSGSSVFYGKEDFECKCGCKICNMDIALIAKLSRASTILKKKLEINSGCRCVSHNEAEDGSVTSSHITTDKIKGKAVDVICIKNADHPNIIKVLKSVGVKRFIYYPKKKIIHIDIDPRKAPCNLIEKQKK